MLSVAIRRPAFICFFCRGDASLSRAKEHIIPACLGNEDHVLPPGLICDRCNNYFGRKIEHPVLASPYFQNLRARQGLTSRAGNPLLWDGIAITGGSNFRANFSTLEKSVFFDPFAIDGMTRVGTAMARAAAQNTGGRLFLPYGVEEPEPKVLSRFFAKIGLEVLAHRFLRSPDFTTVIYDPQLDPLRNWARCGTGALQWPVHRRRLYEEEHRFSDCACPERYQVLHEFDLLATDSGEIYAVICLFGEEFAINLGGPETEGYEAWLKEHDQASPLYSGKYFPLVALIEALDLVRVKRLILVGDPNQLPPIGPGRPFADLVGYLDACSSSTDQKRKSLADAQARLTVEVRSTAGGEDSDTIRLASWFTREPQTVNADRILGDIELGNALNDLEIRFWKTPDELRKRLLEGFVTYLDMTNADDVAGFNQALGFGSDGKLSFNDLGQLEKFQVLSPHQFVRNGCSI